MTGKKLTGYRCPECWQPAYVDTWKPPLGCDRRMRKFMCSDCGLEFYVPIKDREELKRYDRQPCRR